MDLCAVYGNMGGARSGDACAVTNKVVAAVAVEGQGGVVDGNHAAAVYINTAEVIRLGIHRQAVYRGIRDLASQHRRSNRLLRHILAVGDHNGICHLKMIHLAVVLIIHLHGIRHRQHHIAGVGPRLDLAVDAVHRQGQALARRCRKSSVGCNGQRSKLLRCFRHIAAADDFFIHRKLSF